VAGPEIAMIKIAAPNMACRVIDWVIQAFGGAGVTNDFHTASAYATARLLRIADGPDEVHHNQLARGELKRHRNTDPALTGGWAEVREHEAAPKADAPTPPGRTSESGSSSGPSPTPL
jgi:acyl-CoA dehydrogenase